MAEPGFCGLWRDSKLFLRSRKWGCSWWAAAMKLKDTCFLKKNYNQPRQQTGKQRHYFANKGSSSQGYGFSSGHVWMWELDYKESWVLKNWWFWTVVFEKTLESPLGGKEIQPVHPKGNPFWVFIGRTDVEAETPVFAELTHLKRPWCWERLKARGEGDDRGWDGWMASPTQWTWVWVDSGSWWWTGRPGVLRFNGGLKESDTTERLNWTELNRKTNAVQGHWKNPDVENQICIMSNA